MYHFTKRKISTHTLAESTNKNFSITFTHTKKHISNTNIFHINATLRDARHHHIRIPTESLAFLVHIEKCIYRQRMRRNGTSLYSSYHHCTLLRHLLKQELAHTDVTHIHSCIDKKNILNKIVSAIYVYIAYVQVNFHCAA